MLVIQLLVLIQGCSNKKPTDRLPFFNTPDFMPVWLNPGDTGYTNIHSIPPFRFLNQLNMPVSNRNTAGKIYVANFFFTSCPTLCPKTMANLALVQQVFESDTNVLILSHSVTPIKDSVPILRQYAVRHHIDGKRWWLLTGDHDLLYSVARKGYFADSAAGYEKASDQLLHSENLILVDKYGRIRGVYNGTLPFEVNRLIRHIKLLEVEKDN